MALPPPRLSILAVLLATPAIATELGPVPLFGVIDLALDGPRQDATDAPSRDIELRGTFRHASGDEIVIDGFWDGGDAWILRFTPVREGRWTLTRVASNVALLDGQREGDALDGVASSHPGRWIADGPWYRRSDGSRRFIVGNTHYSFISRRGEPGAPSIDPVADVRANARFYSKLRFTLVGDRYPDPDDGPFLDDAGAPSQDGRNSFRPNPRWFRERVDPVIREAHALDVVCDLILCGPDTREARSTLAGDAEPWLRYIAARYGAFASVWLCLANEWDIKSPSYTAAEIRARGDSLRSRLAWATPVSVHGKPDAWDDALTGSWHDHIIIQSKRRSLAEAADLAAAHVARYGRPVLNDENAYQGAGDRFSLEDVLEGCLGTVLGGGSPTTGMKPGAKIGQYFRGGFDAREHSASERLLMLRRYLDDHVLWWTLAPLDPATTPLRGASEGSRVLGREGAEYLLGTNAAGSLAVDLPPGVWRIAQLDLVRAREATLERAAQGRVTIDLPASRATLTHIVRVAESVDRTPADVVLRGGKVVTADARLRIAQAMAVRGAEIVAIGTDDEIAAWRGPDTRVVELAGRTVIPGLIDSHVHPGGASLHEVDHAIPEMETIADVLAHIQERARIVPEGEWIRVRQVFITRLREQRYPTRAELDEAAPRHAVVFATGPDASLNALALERAGIDRDFRVPDGEPGKVERDASGEPTGILRGLSRYIPYRDSGPPIPEETRRERLRALFRDYNSVGITSIADRNASPGDIERYRALRDAGELTVRVFVSHGVDPSGTEEEAVARVREAAAHPLATGGDDRLRVGGVKVFLDGGMLTGSAYLREPWGRSAIYGIDDPEYRGVRFIAPERLVRLVDAAVEGGLQYTAHSVGDGAVDALLDAYAEVSRTRPIRDVRPCITHSNFMSEAAIARMVELGVVADIQPAWLWLDTRTLHAQFGDESLRWFQPLASIFAAGAIAGGGSDHMQKIGALRAINPYDPFLAMWVAMTRRARWHDAPLHPEEALTREQALRFFTANNAILLRSEERTGSLEVGKAADFAVLDRDILTCDIDAVRDTEVLSTWLGGEEVWTR